MLGHLDCPNHIQLVGQRFQATGGPLSRLFHEGTPRRSVMPLPGQETPVAAAQSGRDVRGNQRRLDGQGARATHGIHERAAARGDLRPARAQQDGRREILLQRGRDPHLPVTPAVQRLAGEIEAHGSLVAQHIDVDADLRPLGVDGRSHAPEVPELIDDGILDLQRAEVAVTDGGLGRMEVDREGLVGVEVGAPVDRPYAVVERLWRRGRKARGLAQHRVGHPRPEADPVGRLQRAREARARAGLGHVRTAERTQFVHEQRFHVARCRGKEAEKGHGGR